FLSLTPTSESPVLDARLLPHTSLSPVFDAALHSLLFLPGTAATAFSTLSLHDALPILLLSRLLQMFQNQQAGSYRPFSIRMPRQDRKSTRLNSSHVSISYAVFCLKKKIIRSPQHFLNSMHQFHHCNN